MKFVAATILALATSASAFAPAPSASVSSFFKHLTFEIIDWSKNFELEWNGIDDDTYICEDEDFTICLWFLPLRPFG